MSFPLRFVVPEAIERKLVTELERCDFHRMQINKEVEYTGCHYQCEIYYNVTRNEDGVAIFFNYWGVYNGSIYVLGSGGYIPELHERDKRMYEFFLKKYDIPEFNKIEQ
jgi:hypothetical protein